MGKEKVSSAYWQTFFKKLDSLRSVCSRRRRMSFLFRSLGSISSRLTYDSINGGLMYYMELCAESRHFIRVLSRVENDDSEFSSLNQIILACFHICCSIERIRGLVHCICGT